jgi:hypothetical protein
VAFISEPSAAVAAACFDAAAADALFALDAFAPAPLRFAATELVD